MLRVRNCLLVSLAVYLHVTTCDSFRILGVFPMPAPSHYFLGSNLLKGIAEAGHDVTIMSPFSEKNPPKNGSWREIVLEGHEVVVRERLKHFTTSFYKYNPYNMMVMMSEMTRELTEMTLNHTEVQKLMNSNEKFDVVIVAEFMMDALKVFSNKFDANLVSFSNHGILNWYYYNIGHFVPPSIFPEASLAYPPKMSFFQRTKNSVLHVIMRIAQKYIFYPYQQALAAKYFPGAPDLDDIVQNVSLALVNSHISLNFPHPKVPLLVEVAGFHVKPPKPLPSDLQKLLDNSKDGVIYFSVGSNFKSDDLPPEVLDTIMRTFSRRKETILWKWGQDTLPGKPNNVHLGKWFPQQDILAHPNVKLFITHSGFLSTIETIYHGVPIVSVPLAADQKLNARAAVFDGYGETVSLDNFDEYTFGGAIDDVISNPKYLNTAKERSRIFHDRQRPPIEDAVYWVEYIVRHNGAKHLRVPYLNLRWYEYYMLDVIGFVAVLLITSLYILKLFLFFVMRKCIIRPLKIKKS